MNIPRPQDSPATAGKRQDEPDYLKAVCILLMVLFHLVPFGDYYPHSKAVVYTFHMPVFLLLSGYFLRTTRPVLSFLHTQWWLFLPYALMEAAYVSASTVLPVRGGEAEVSLPILLHRIFLNPLGPYWFLHTLLLCRLLHYVAARLSRYGLPVFIATLTLLLAAVCALRLAAPSNVFFYLAGATLAQTNTPLLRIFRPSLPLLLPAILLCCFPHNLQSFSIPGIAIIYCVVSFLLWTLPRLASALTEKLLFIGRNTLPVLLFSPIFTQLSKHLLPLFAFDGSRILFGLVATALCIAGSLLVATAIDRLRLTPYFCGRQRLLAR